MRPTHSTLRDAAAAKRVRLRPSPPPRAPPAFQARERVEEHAEPFARLMAADEEDRGAVGGPRGGFGELGNVDTVGDDLVVAVERELHELGGLLRDRGPDRQPGQPSLQRRPEHPVPRIEAT
jgi:hypothetical protein